MRASALQSRSAVCSLRLWLLRAPPGHPLHHTSLPSTSLPRPTCLPVSWVQWWCRHDPKTGKPRAKQFAPNLNGPDAAKEVQKGADFLQWFVMQGHPGYKVGLLCRLQHLWPPLGARSAQLPR